MNKNKKVSIIIVTYNADNHIGSALESLKGKINDSVEVVIIDGLSNDNTLEIIGDYSDCVSVLISEKDSGIYDAMNKGVAMASGEFILFLGADDQLIVNISELSNILTDNDTIYYGDVVLNPTDKIYGGKFNTADLINRNICHQSIFYPKEVFKTYRFDLDYKYMADYLMNLQLWSSKKFKFFYFKKVISSYSVAGLSSTTIDEKFRKDSFKLIYIYYGFYGLFIKSLNPLRNFFSNKNIK